MIFKIRLAWHLVRLARSEGAGWLQAIRAIQELVGHYQSNGYYSSLRNVRRVGRQYIWSLYLPPFPSPAFDQLWRKEFRKLWGQAPDGLSHAVYAFTNACPLNCAHCFEWDHLNQATHTTDQVGVLRQLARTGVSQVFLSGGEPLSDYPTLIQLLREAQNLPLALWVNTSGVGLSLAKARELKALGLVGLVFSLDHHQPEAHNAFRGRRKVYDQVVEGIGHAQAAGLLTAVSLCPTQDFISSTNLTDFAQLLQTLHVDFWQWMEPKAQGRYQHQAELGPENKATLAEFYHQYKARLPEPVILSYPDYKPEGTECLGGKSYLYIDTHHQAHACPFCKAEGGSPVQEGQPITLSEGGCQRCQVASEKAVALG